MLFVFIVLVIGFFFFFFCGVLSFLVFVLVIGVVLRIMVEVLFNLRRWYFTPGKKAAPAVTPSHRESEVFNSRISSCTM